MDNAQRLTLADACSVMSQWLQDADREARWVLKFASGEMLPCTLAQRRQAAGRAVACCLWLAQQGASALNESELDALLNRLSDPNFVMPAFAEASEDDLGLVCAELLTLVDACDYERMLRRCRDLAAPLES